MPPLRSIAWSTRSRGRIPRKPGDERPVRVAGSIYFPELTMTSNSRLLLGALVAALATVAAPSRAQVRITEVAPWASGNAPYASDWFELTNMGAVSVDISGWKMDDNSFSFSSAVALTGITRIAPGESVIFTETATRASFLGSWFGAHPPAGIQVGNYTGAGVGLSTGGDGVGIFDGQGVLQARLSFGASDNVAPYQSFDNAAGLNDVVVSTLSVAGVHGAFAASTGSQIGSIAAVPEPDTYALLLAGLGIVGTFVRRRAHA